MNLLDVQAEEAQRQAAATPSGETGVIVSVTDDRKATVNCNGSVETVWVPLDIYGLAPNDPVIIQRASGLAWVAGRLPGARVLPTFARVTTAAPGSSTVTVYDPVSKATFSLPFLSSYTPAVNDNVRITWEMGTGVVLGKLGAVPNPPPDIPADPAGVVVNPPPPPPPPVAQTGVATFPALDARSFRGGKWRTDSGVIAQGSYGSFGTNNGAWFYGMGPKASLAGAVITRCQIRVRRNSGGDYAAQAVHFRPHSSATRPAANVTYTAVAANTQVDRFQTIWADVPPSWGQAAVDSGYGIGIEGAPYVNIAGLDEDSESGLMRLEWKRN